MILLKLPTDAKQDLEQIFDLVGDKNIGIFEISWSTSDFVGGSDFFSKRILRKII